MAKHDNPYTAVSLPETPESGDYNEFKAIADSTSTRIRSRDMQQFMSFIDRAEWKATKGDTDLNLWEQGGTYRLLKCPISEIQSFFGYYEKCRKLGIIMHWTQKQPELYSGWRCDYDVYQPSKTRIITEKIIRTLVLYNMKQAVKIIDFDEKEWSTLVVVSLRPEVTYSERMKKWKDGIHIDAPGIMISRAVKRIITKHILEAKVASRAFASIPDIEPETFLDAAGCHVPLVLLGSCKQGNRPYEMKYVYKVTFESDDVIIEPDVWFLDDSNATRINYSLELNVNWPGVVIQRRELNPRATYRAEIEIYKRHTDTERDEESELINDLDEKSANDPEYSYTRELLELLKPYRYNNYKEWFKVVSALVNTSDKYIPLARWWSRKSEKFDEAGFQDCVTNARLKHSTYQLTLGHIRSWASRDNPALYSSLDKKSVYKRLLEFIFDDICQGKLGHAHFAELLLPIFKDKYRTEMLGKTRVWYEFKYPNDKMEPGQAYKWVQTMTPDSLHRYLHNQLHPINLQAARYLEEKIRSPTADAAAVVYYSNLRKNFATCGRQIWDDRFQGGIVRQLERMYSQPGFGRQLDQNPYAIGVKQGILMLSPTGDQPKLVAELNPLLISRYTGTEYKPFNPQDPMTRRLLRAMRSQHPDNETDVFEFKMTLKAATIDGRPREAIMTVITGPGSNGKSFEFELHQSALGDKYCTSMPISLLVVHKESSAESATPMLAKLEHARCAYYEEGSETAVLYLPMIKRLVGGNNLAGRQLYETAEHSIRANAYHILLSNHKPQIRTHEYAVWRRLRFIFMPIMFKDHDYDEKNPLHRKIDRSFNTILRESPECKSAYLSIMVYFHRRLMWKFGGIVDHVPHPTVDRHTTEFRHSQDTLSRFVDSRIVKSDEQLEYTPIETVLDIYIAWYSANISSDTRHYKREIKASLAESSIKNLIEETSSGMRLKPGYRVLSVGEDPKAGETLLDHMRSDIKETKYETKFPTETPDEYLDRVDREYKEMEDHFKSLDSSDLSRSYKYDMDDETYSSHIKELTNPFTAVHTAPRPTESTVETVERLLHDSSEPTIDESVISELSSYVEYV